MRRQWLDSYSEALHLGIIMTETISDGPFTELVISNTYYTHLCICIGQHGRVRRVTLSLAR